jgi:hypothetical protein
MTSAAGLGKAPTDVISDRHLDFMGTRGTMRNDGSSGGRGGLIRA